MTRTHHVGFRQSRFTGWSNCILHRKLNLLIYVQKRSTGLTEASMFFYPVSVMSTERGAERPPARKVSLGALKVSSSFPLGTLCALALSLSLSRTDTEMNKIGEKMGYLAFKMDALRLKPGF